MNFFYFLVTSSEMTYYFSRYRRERVPEPMPVPEPSVIDAKGDSGNVGGYHESGGVHLIEVHSPTVFGAGGVVALILMIVLVCWLISKGHLQRCCLVCAEACCGGRDGGLGRAEIEGGGEGGRGVPTAPSETPAAAAPPATPPTAPIVFPPVPMMAPMMPPPVDVVRLQEMKSLADLLAERAARRDRRY